VSRVLYFDCFAGISGDMTLGALLDAGLPLADLKQALGTLATGDAHVHADRVLRANVAATKFRVHEHAGGAGEHAHEHGHAASGSAHHHAHRSLAEIFALIDQSALSASARARAKAMFQRLG